MMRSAELNRLRGLLEKSLRDALEVEMLRLRAEDLKVTGNFPDAVVRMRIPEGRLEMTGSLHGLLRDALSSWSEWDFRRQHVRRGGTFNLGQDERSALRSIASSLRNSLEAARRVSAPVPHANPHILDALAIVRACLATSAQIKWDKGEEGLRPLKASLRSTFRTYREYLARYESEPSQKAMADHCTSKIQSVSRVLKKVSEGVAAAKRVERLSRKAMAELETACDPMPNR